jgi:autotransporter-associated beta strand protein
MKATQPNHPQVARPQPSLRLALQLAAFSCAGLYSSAFAADVTLLRNDAVGTSSFDKALNWSNAAAPSPDNDYFTNGFTVRTSLTAGDYVFGGASLQLDQVVTSRILGKGAGSNTTQTLTIPNLVMNGGRLEQANGVTTTGVVLAVKGNISVTGPSYLGAIGVNASGTSNFETLDIQAPISGSEGLTVGDTVNAGDNRGVVRLSAANPYTGEIDVKQPTGTISSATNRLLQLNHPDALRYAALGLYTTSENGVSFAAAANPSGTTFRIASLSGFANQSLSDTAGNPVTLEIGGTGLDSFYSATLKGNGNLVKAGAGTLTIEGQSQTFSGSVTVLGGVLVLGDDVLLNNSTTVSVATGAKLDLEHPDTDVVAGLTLGGAAKPDGVYDSSTPGGYITGPGKIQVNTGAPLPENVKLIATDALGTSSFNAAGNWNNGAAPSAVNHYFTQNFAVRTPVTDGSFTFAGASLSIDAGGRLIGKGSGTANAVQTLNLPNLILNGGILDQAGSPSTTGVVLSVNGNINVAAPSFLGALGGGNGSVNFETLDIASTITGTESLTVAGTINLSADVGLVRLSAANDYAGTITVAQPNGIASATNRLLQLNHLGALSKATLSLATTSANGVSFASAVNTGPFKIDGLTGTASQTLADTAGAPVKIDVGGNNGTSTFDGTLDGPGSLVKSGTGALTLTGLNSYTGDTTVSSGTLVLSQATLADTSAVSIGSGAVLNLPHGQVDVVKSLVLNNVAQAAGTYTVANSGGLITGTGSIQVISGGSTGFAGFMDQYTGLTAEQKALGADPDGDGISNLLEYALDGLNPTTPNVLPTLVNGKLSFAKRALAVSNGDVTYTIEVSGTLGADPEPWTAVTPDANDATTISYTLPAGSLRKFVRLRVDTTP